MRLSDVPFVLWDQLRLRQSRRRGLARYGDPRSYYPEGVGHDDPGFLAELDRINDDLPGFLDPGPVEAPPADRIRRDGDLLGFPSPRPTGDPAVDEVVVKVYPAPPDAPPVGVLFHHWVLLEKWDHIDFLLRPLVGRCRLAAMVGPHHLTRRRPGFRPGEGIINPNPLDIFAAIRQWHADYAATRALLRRDHGFERTLVLGYSIGAYNTFLSFLYRPALPLVSVCCTNNYPLGVFEGNAMVYMRRALAELGFDRERFTRAVRSLHLARHARGLDGSQVTFIRAREDWIEPPESMLELPRELGPDREIAVPGGHASAVFFRRRIAREVMRRLDRVAASSG